MLNIIYYILFLIIVIILLILSINLNIVKKNAREKYDMLDSHNERLNELEDSYDQDHITPIDINLEPIDDNKFYKLPEQGSKFAAGYDLYWSTVNKELNEDGSVTINPGETLKFGTNLRIEICLDNYYLDICSRSGMSINKNLCVINSPARIDSDYRGELIIGLKNFSDEPKIIEAQSRIAQCTLHRIVPIAFYEYPVNMNTDRSDGGLGHSGETIIEKR